MNIDLAYLQKEFLGQIQFIRRELTEIKKNRDGDEMWDNSDLTRNWKVSLRTLAEWRAEGKIGYVQIGNKIWYPREERELFIASNLVKVKLKNGGEVESK